MGAATVKEAVGLMTRLRAAGMSYSAIAALLNQRGYAAARGGRWYGSSVYHMLAAARRPVQSVPSTMTI